MGDSSKINNIYLSTDLNILSKSGEVKDLGILMSENCEFDNHIATVVKKCSRLCGWILKFNGLMYSDSSSKRKILNKQFQSVFTKKTPQLLLDYLAINTHQSETYLLL